MTPSMGLPIKRLGGKSLADLLAAGAEGIPKLSIPDA